jgi:hypothetical protein
MSSARTIGRITAAIGAGITAVAISLTAHDSASATRPLCQDDVDCLPPAPSTTRRSTTTTTSPVPPPTTSSVFPQPPPTTWSPTQTTTSRRDSPPACPLHKPCAEQPVS